MDDYGWKDVALGVLLVLVVFVPVFVWLTIAMGGD